jgi:hypothetical protein
MSDFRWGFRLDIGFIGQFSTLLVMPQNYGPVTDFHTLHITPAHAKSLAHFSVFTRGFLVTASNDGYSSASVLNSSLNGGSLPTALVLQLTNSQAGGHFTPAS